MRRGLVASRAEAHDAITAGRVTVDGAPALKAAYLVRAEQPVVVHGPARRFVSRGGEKLDAGLTAFGIDVHGRRCLDAGASTGGFTDRLLRGGADSVVAIDVGYGQLHDRLRTDPRVTVLERTNVRTLTPEDIPPPPPDFVVADLSFISLELVLPALRAVADPHAEAVVLVKPQFEAGREQAAGGVVRDPAVRAESIRKVVTAARRVGWSAVAVVASPLPGPAGNVEFLLHLVPGPVASAIDAAIDAAVTEPVGVQR